MAFNNLNAPFMASRLRPCLPKCAKQCSKSGSHRLSSKPSPQPKLRRTVQHEMPTFSHRPPDAQNAFNGPDSHSCSKLARSRLKFLSPGNLRIALAMFANHRLQNIVSIHAPDAPAGSAFATAMQRAGPHCFALFTVPRPTACNCLPHTDGQQMAVVMAPLLLANVARPIWQNRHGIAQWNCNATPSKLQTGQTQPKQRQKKQLTPTLR